MEPQGAEVRIVRAADLEKAGNSFQAPIEGNMVTSFGLIELGAARLVMALVETEAGVFFPFQYHAGGGMEMAVIIAGAGAIEVGESEGNKQVHEFGCGDIVFIPPGIIYRVCNRRTDEKLVAWVFFAESTRSYWPDGTPA
jgi:quercetin dioxygenase-like cupin family protein